MSKARKLLDCCQEKEDCKSLGQPSKKIKLEDKENFDSANVTENKITKVWLSLKDPTITLSVQDKEAITSGKQLSDLHIPYRQCLLKRQFPEVQGLSCTLLQT